MLSRLGLVALAALAALEARAPVAHPAPAVLVVSQVAVAVLLVEVDSSLVGQGGAEKQAQVARGDQR